MLRAPTSAQKAKSEASTQTKELTGPHPAGHLRRPTGPVSAPGGQVKTRRETRPQPMSSIQHLLLLRRRRDGPIHDEDVMRVAHLALRREGGEQQRAFKAVGSSASTPFAGPARSALRAPREYAARFAAKVVHASCSLILSCAKQRRRDCGWCSGRGRRKRGVCCVWLVMLQAGAPPAMAAIPGSANSC